MTLKGIGSIFVVLFCLLALSAGLSLAAPPNQGPDQLPDELQGLGQADLQKIEPLVITELGQNGQTDFFIWLVEKADLSPAYQLVTKAEKGEFVFRTLRDTADRSQVALRQTFATQGVQYRSFYIANKILVQGGTAATVAQIAVRPDVARITANHPVQLEPPIDAPRTSAAPLIVESNLSFINANDVWALGITGNGVVLAGNDTGIEWGHDALINQYRGWDGVSADHNYNWWDATGTYTSEPGDGHSHGTHTTGTMVGDDGGTNQIGVAPGAQMIHCKNLDDFGFGSDSTIIECFEWNLAPWDLSGANPRPDLAPDVVNNSWGSSGGQPEYEDEIAALQAAGILVEFSAGNSGSSCNTLGSPGDYEQVLSTGSVNHSGGTLPGTITWFSSRGPSSLYPNEYIPDIMAPGEVIRSSVPGNAYSSKSGTSMSGPHVTALVGLMWSANPALRGDIETTTEMIKETAVPLTGQTGSTCGGDYTTGPNNDWGWGTVDALAAVQAALAYGGSGDLVGTVTDSGTATPIADTTILATLSPTQTWQIETDVAGDYLLRVLSGTYTIDVSRYGYLPAQMTNISVVSGTTTTVNFALTPAPSHLVSGFITDAATGWPLYAQISINGYPGGPIWSDPETGFYSVSLAEGLAYTFEVEAWVSGYQPTTRIVGPLTGDQTEDFAVVVDGLACTAPGYTPDHVYLEDFEASDGGYTHTGINDEWEWGTPTIWPYTCASGNNCWGTDLDGDYEDDAIQTLTSPTIDLSSVISGTEIALIWQQAWSIESAVYDEARAEVKIGAGPWQTMWSHTDGTTKVEWTKLTYDLSAAAGNNVQLRWTLEPDYVINYEGLYLDDVAITTGCTPSPGGLVVGNVYDANTNDPLNNAQVSHDEGALTISMATPSDPAVDDGFYTLFASSGTHVFSATLSGYSPDIQTPTVVENSTIRQDFHLAIGQLVYTPDTLEATLGLGDVMTVPFSLSNIGDGSATFELRERDQGFKVSALAQQMVYPRQRVESQSPADVAPVNEGAAPFVWSAGAPIPTGPRYRSAGASCDGDTYYIFGGWDDSGGVLNESWQYDPVTDNWTALANMPFALTNMEAACINDSIYLVGGYDGQAVTNDFLIYNVASDSWTATTLPHVRLPMTAVWEEKLYAFGGYPGPSNEMWVYDPATHIWTGPLASAPTAVAFGALVTVDDYLYQVGGPDTNHVQRYDPVNDSWDDSGPQLQDERMSPLVVWYGDAIYVVSGGGNNFNIWDPWDTTEVYDPSVWPGGSWTYHAETVPSPAVAMAGDCAADQIWGAGGLMAGYFETDANQALADGAACHFDTDAPWLDEAPKTGTVAPNETLPVTIIFDASVPEVTQPGQYAAQLQVLDDTPYQLPAVPVSMTVTAPNNYGKLTGLVSSLGHCDADPTPLEGASLLIEGSGGLTHTVETDETGAYTLWLNEAQSPFSVNAMADEHQTEMVSNVIVTGQATTTLDIDLRWLQPCLSITPASLSEVVSLGQVKTRTLTLVNAGGIGSDFNFYETDGGASLLSLDAINPLHQQGSARVISETPEVNAGGAVDGMQSLSRGGPDPYGYTYRDSTEPDGPVYEWVEIAPPAGGSGIELTDLSGVDNGYFWPLTLPFPFSFYGTTHTDLAVATNGTLYFVDDYLGLFNEPIPDSNAYGVYTFIAHLWDDLIVSPGAIYYQATPEMLIIEYYQVGHDDTSGAGTWQVILFVDGRILYQYQDVQFNGYPDDGASATIGIQGDTATGLQYSYNTAALSNGLAICFAPPNLLADCAIDVPWVSEVPENGIVVADSNQAIEIVFDATVAEVTGPGDYYATLNLSTDDPLTPVFQIPVTMTVSQYGVALSTAEPTQGGDPDTIVTYMVELSNTGSVTDSFDLSISGHNWHTTGPASMSDLPSGTGQSFAVQVSVPATAAAGDTDQMILTAQSQGDTGQTAVISLTTIANPVYGLTLSPPAQEKSGVPGQLISYGFTVTNIGNTTDSFIVEVTGNNWPTVAPFEKNAPNVEVRVGPIAANSSAEFELDVVIPLEATAAETDTATIILVSEHDDSQTAAATLLTTVEATEDEYPQINVATTEQAGNPSTTVAYTVQMTNTGNTSDTFTISIAENSWPTEAPAATAPLDRDESFEFEVVVTIPADVMAGAKDVSTVSIASLNQEDKAAVAFQLTTTASAVYGLAVEAPLTHQSGNPGNVVNYTLTVTNSGNMTDTYLLTMSGNSWLTAVSTGESRENIGLQVAPDEQATVQINVFISAEAASSITDTVTITVTSAGDAMQQEALVLTTTSEHLPPPTKIIFLPLVVNE